MTRLGDVAELISGQHVNAEHVNSAGIGNPYLTGPSDFDAGKPRATKWTKHGKAFCEPGDILITVKGSGCGTMAIADRRYVISRQLMAIRPLNIHVGFLWATLSREIARLNAMSSGTIPGLTRDQILKIPIPHFSHKVQRWIGDLDNLLTRLQQCLRSLIAAKREFKRGLMQELLTGRRRFPEFASEPWIEAPLGELFSERSETGFEHLPLLAVTGDRGVVLRDELDRRDTSSKDKSKYKRVCPGDIAYNTMRMWQGVSGLSQYEGIVSPAYTVVTPTGPMMGRYARHLFKLPRIVHSFWRHSQGLVDDTLSLKFPRFAIIQVTFPSRLDEQQRIASVLDAIDREIEVLIHIRTAYDNQKRGLMQKLLTGELTVPVSSEPEPVHA